MKTEVYLSMSIKHTIRVKTFNVVLLKAQMLKYGHQIALGAANQTFKKLLGSWRMSLKGMVEQQLSLLFTGLLPGYRSKTLGSVICGHEPKSSLIA